MFCWKCGAENPDGAKFCKKCGAAFEKEPDKNVSNNKSENLFGQYNEKSKVQWKTVLGSKKKIIIASAAIAAAVLIIGVSFAIRNGISANIDKIATYTASVEEVKNAKVGDVIKFGSYEQDNDLSNGAEPIEWQVLGTRDGHTILLSKYALDCEYEHRDKLNMDITWENCTLRSWLNNDFYNTAFSTFEKERIVTAHNENPDSYELYRPYNTSSYTYGARGGNATDDKVFLLSWTEARDYLDGKLDETSRGKNSYNQKLLCRPTVYAKAQMVETYSNRDNYYPADTVGCCWWRLRSPGIDQRYLSFVNCTGALYSPSIADSPYHGVRPVILIDEGNVNYGNTQSSSGKVDEKTQSNNSSSTNQVNWLQRDPAYDLFGDSTAR